MFSRVCVLLLAIGLSQAVRLPLLPESPMIKLMMRSSEASQNDPQRSLSCFNEYLPLFNQANENFQAAYAKCLSDADASRAGIDESTKDERAQIDGSATSACKALDTCSQNTDSVEYFTCYSESGGENSKTMYEISANAAEWLAKVQEEYRLIDVNEYACTNKTQRNHVAESAAIYENFDRCLLGLEPLTTAPPAESTSEPSTTVEDEDEDEDDDDNDDKDKDEDEIKDEDEDEDDDDNDDKDEDEDEIKDEDEDEDADDALLMALLFSKSV